MMKLWFKSGVPWIWLNAAAVSISLIMIVGVLGLVTVRGVGHFWPHKVTRFSYQEENKEPQIIIGEKVDSSVTPAAMAKSTGFKMADNEDTLVQHLIKTGNRDVTGSDFRWIQERNVKEHSDPADMMVVERREWGNFYGQLLEVKEALAIFKEIAHLEKKEIGAINYALERLRLKQRKLELKNSLDDAAKQQIATEKAGYEAEYKQYQTQLAELYQKIRRVSLVAKTESGSTLEIPLSKVVRAFQPNAMSVFDKIAHYGTKVAEFVTDDPREANTEGGIFPAIFGTIMMVMIMSVIVAPFGVIAAVYLREYAKQGFTTRLIRIAVNNLAGVPSVVYGVFGLGFFVYILGGNIDQLFFPESAPAPVFGTPGLLWASITLALLTLPVVIVSTEEGLARIPSSIREGS
ncbi:MAG: phosphate transport system permease protein [Methylococcaceae bacterium NSP1-1]|nr:MAG: phosphate transport system permease protein [Methylococcaceae bacterium NSP1-1]